MPYFTRLDQHRYLATDEAGGAWDPEDQHIAPALGLLAHAVELDRDQRRTDRLPIGRLSYDILGTVPVDEIEIHVRVLRPGRTIELVEATMSHAGRDIVLLRVWLMQGRDTAALAGTSVPALPAPEDFTAWDPIWPGGFIGSVEVRREQDEPGRARCWVRTRSALVEGEPVSDFARFVGLLDIANGMTVRVDPKEVAFPNLDLTAHFFREPAGEWVGFDTTVSFGATGRGLTSSVLHDLDGPVGMLEQILTVRPKS